MGAISQEVASHEGEWITVSNEIEGQLGNDIHSNYQRDLTLEGTHLVLNSLTGMIFMVIFKIRRQDHLACPPRQRWCSLRHMN